MEPFACEGSRRRNPDETARYALERHGIALCEGFGEIAECRGGVENSGRIASFMEFGRGTAWYVSQGAPDAAVTWRTAPVPAEPESGDVVFVFSMALGNGSPLPQPSGRFILAVNGQETLSFRVTKYQDHWQGNGAHFVFQPRRLEAAAPGHLLYLDDVITQESFAAFGLGLLRVPRSLAPPGEPVTITVTPENPAPSTRYFKIDSAQCIGRTNLYVGLDEVCGDGGRPKIGDTYVYFGDIHTHSGWPNGGCGMGSLDENYAYARDISNLDIYALTDHDLHMGDPEMWQARVDAANRYYEPGSFCVLQAYEFTSSLYGHRNVYYRGDSGPMLACRSEGDYWSQAAPTPDDLWRFLDESGERAMTIPHHPPASSHPLTWDYYSPEHDRLVEIYSSWGNHEVPLNPLRGYGSDRYEHLSVREALLKGYTMGFMASSDGHDGHPGNNQSPDVKHHHLYHPLGSGRICVLAPELTREAVFDAMHERRCYATTGPHIAMSVTLNGHPMGSLIRAGDLDGPPVLSATVSAPWIVERVQVVKSGAVVADFGSTRHALQAEFAWPDNAFDPNGTGFYYVRLTLADGEMAWSSPIWITPGGTV